MKEGDIVFDTFLQGVPYALNGSRDCLTAGWRTGGRERLELEVYEDELTAEN